VSDQLRVGGLLPSPAWRRPGVGLAVALLFVVAPRWLGGCAPTAEVSCCWSDAILSSDFACGLRTSGELECWGDTIEEDGQPTIEAVLDPPEAQLGRLATGWFDLSVCGATSDGRLSCWGDDYRLRQETDFAGAVAMPSGAWDELGMSSFHACASSDAQGTRCWGRDLSCEAPDPRPQCRLFEPRGPRAAVTVGDWMACGRAVGDGWTCWGAVEAGDPDSGLSSNYRPEQVRAFEAGSWSSARLGPSGDLCALDEAGGVACFVFETTGYNQAGSTISEAFGYDGGYVQVGLGVEHVCALDESGAIVCVGEGLAARDGRAVYPEEDFEALVVGPQSTCGISDSGILRCWGEGGSMLVPPP